jgi:hypothetical protein
MRYRLRTLLILLAILPPLLGIGYIRWQRYRERQRLLEIVKSIDYGENLGRAWQAFVQAQAAQRPPADDSGQENEINE